MCRNTDDPAAEDESCRCRNAALNAYRGMIGGGADEPSAMGAAFKVYRYYHPTDIFCEAHLTVERLIYGQHPH